MQQGLSKLKPIEISHVAQRHQAAANTARVQGLIAGYNDIVRLLSQKFVFYSQLLTKYEAFVDEALMEKALVPKACPK